MDRATGRMYGCSRRLTAEHKTAPVTSLTARMPFDIVAVLNCACAYCERRLERLVGPRFLHSSPAVWAATEREHYWPLSEVAAQELNGLLLWNEA